MSGKLVITKRNGQVVSALYEENHLVEIQFQPEVEQGFSLGNIYVAQVKNVVKNINSAFLDIGQEKLFYYSLGEKEKPIFLNRKNSDKVAEGDILLVQVQKEAIKTKLPIVSSVLNFTGKYLVLTVGKCGIGLSSKIQKEEDKQRFKQYMSEWNSKEYGWIVRTNALGSTKEQLDQEAKRLVEEYENIISIAQFRTKGQCLYEAPKSYIAEIRDQKAVDFQRIITDDRHIYEQLQEYLEKYQQEDREKLEWYEDENLSLSSLLSLETDIQNAFKERVWLKSGGYLVIQPTEALTVIDVNTGKSVNKKNPEEHFRLINLEAAKEVAKQLRLRNLSGIIIVDFIDLKAEEAKEELLNTLRRYVAQDRIKTDVIDITKLNLVEMTRKKIKKPIYEQIKEQNE